MQAKAQPNESVGGKDAARKNYFEQKEREREIKRRQKRVAACEEDISRIEDEIKEVENCLATGGSLPPDIYDRHAELNKKLENAMSAWEIACSDLEALNANNNMGL